MRNCIPDLEMIQGQLNEIIELMKDDKKPKKSKVKFNSTDGKSYFHGLWLDTYLFENFMNSDALIFIKNNDLEIRIENAISWANKRYNRRLTVLEVYEFGNGLRNYGKHSDEIFKETVYKRLKKFEL